MDKVVDSEFIRISEKLPKRFWGKECAYSLIIQKNEWEHHSDAYIIMYAKETKNGFSKVRPFLRVEGHTLLEAMRAMEQAVVEMNTGNINN